MEIKMIISMGDSYGDKKFTFNDDKDALLFFQLLSKATELNRDYITGGMGDVFEIKEHQRNSSFIKYSGVYTKTELSILKEEEDKRLEMEKELAKVEEERERLNKEKQLEIAQDPFDGDLMI